MPLPQLVFYDTFKKLSLHLVLLISLEHKSICENKKKKKKENKPKKKQKYGIILSLKALKI